MKSTAARGAIALSTFILGVVSTWLWVVRIPRPTEKLLPPRVAAVSHPASHPEGWRKIEVDNKFSFYLPPDMKEVKFGNLDFFGPAQIFGYKTLEINYEYIEKRDNEGMWGGKVTCDVVTGNLTDRPMYRCSEEELGGRRAIQTLWQSDNHSLHFMTICIPDVGDGTMLHFRAVSTDERSLGVVKQIFGSVEFP